MIDREFNIYGHARVESENGHMDEPENVEFVSDSSVSELVGESSSAGGLYSARWESLTTVLGQLIDNTIT